MNEELLLIHKSLIDQLKETSTSSYQRFLNAFDLMKEKDEKAVNEYEIICKNSEYLLNSMHFYLDKFIEIDNSEFFLYIYQLLSLTIKSYHNLAVISRNANKDDLSNRFKSLESLRKGELYFYNMLLDLFVINNHAKEILYTFIIDANIEEENKEIGRLFLLDFVNRNNLSEIYFLNHDKVPFEKLLTNLDKYSPIDEYNFQTIIARLKNLNFF